jgi:low affinity Fe/Cu permease
MKKLTPEEKKALQEKIKEAGLDERSKPNQITLSDDKKEEMKKLIAEAERERLERLDKSLHSRSKSKE